MYNLKLKKNCYLLNVLKKKNGNYLLGGALQNEDEENCHISRTP